MFHCSIDLRGLTLRTHESIFTWNELFFFSNGTAKIVSTAICNYSQWHQGQLQLRVYGGKDFPISRFKATLSFKFTSIECEHFLLRNLLHIDSQILYTSAYIWSQQQRLQKLIYHFGNSQTNSITWYLTSPWIIRWILVSQQAVSHRLPDYTVCVSSQFSCRCMQSTVNVWDVPRL